MTTDSNATSPSMIPQSQALAEAQPESLGELFSRDPEGYQRQDLDRVISALREQRVRWQASEAEGRKAKPKGSTALLQATPASAGELGL